jgi:hypothetical protein
LFGVGVTAAVWIALSAGTAKLVLVILISKKANSGLKEGCVAVDEADIRF